MPLEKADVIGRIAAAEAPAQAPMSVCLWWLDRPAHLLQQLGV
jgi:hypothetical protein